MHTSLQAANIIDKLFTSTLASGTSDHKPLPTSFPTHLSLRHNVHNGARLFSAPRWLSTSPAPTRGPLLEIWAHGKAGSSVPAAWRQVTAVNRRACLSSLTLSLLVPTLCLRDPGRGRLAHHLHFSSISHVNNLTSTTRTQNTHSKSKQKRQWILT